MLVWHAVECEDGHGSDHGGVVLAGDGIARIS